MAITGVDIYYRWCRFEKTKLIRDLGGYLSRDIILAILSRPRATKAPLARATLCNQSALL